METGKMTKANSEKLDTDQSCCTYLQLYWVWLIWTLFSPKQPPIVLCCALVATKVLITHQYSGCCWAVLAQHQGCLYNIPPHQHTWESQDLRRGHGWECWPEWIELIFYITWHLFSNESKDKDWGGFVIIFLPWSKPYAYWTLLPGKWLDITCWWRVENKPFVFLLFCCITLPYLDPLSVFSFYFLPHHPAEVVSDRAVWWVPGSLQPGSTHHNSQKISKAEEGKLFFTYFPCLSLDPFLPHHQTNTSSEPSIQKHTKYIPRSGG